MVRLDAAAGIYTRRDSCFATRAITAFPHRFDPCAIDAQILALEFPSPSPLPSPASRARENEKRLIAFQTFYPFISHSHVKFLGH